MTTRSKKDFKFKQFFPANIIEYQFIVGKIKKKNLKLESGPGFTPKILLHIFFKIITCVVNVRYVKLNICRCGNFIHVVVVVVVVVV